MLADFLQNTLDGLSAGASYALLALGFTLIFGVLRRANLSFGPSIMFGAYCATWAHVNFGAGLLLLALISVGGAVLAGAYVERLCFAPHRGGSAIAAMVASFALWMQFEELATLVMPRHLYAFPMLYEGDPLSLGPLTLRVDTLAMLAAALAACALLWWTLYRTRFGLAVRALIEQPAAAALAGINVPWVFMRVFALASALGGIAGYLVVATHGQITPMLGMWATLKGLLAMMLGGLGSLPGAVIGGLALGLIEAHTQWYLGPQLRDLVAYLLLFVLLAARVPWMTTRSAS
ncbi:MAG TPA: branched-chain amino acid ABC transporter permease [Burkholderiales bacterium]|nr:branched-chain amino acid ABC transporter permease [Burkholderiales bacterium]